MIRFQCPRCNSILESPDHKAGQKFLCLKCQQKLQIPIPPPNKTILAPLVPGPASPSIASGPPPAIPVHPVQSGQITPLSIQRAMKNWQKPAAISAVALFLLLVIFVGYRRLSSGSGSDKEGQLAKTNTGMNASPENENPPSVPKGAESKKQHHAKAIVEPGGKEKSKDTSNDPPKTTKASDGEKGAGKEKGKGGSEVPPKISPARALCETIVETEDESKKSKAMEELESVDPEIYKVVITLLVDSSPNNKIRAVRGIKNLEGKAIALVPVLAYFVRKEVRQLDLVTRDSQGEAVIALAEIAAADKVTIDTLKQAIVANDLAIQLHAMRALRIVAKQHPPYRKEIASHVVSRIESEVNKGPMRGWPDMIVVGLQTLEETGTEARGTAPLMKKLKLNPNAHIREGAKKVLKAIDK